jgi:HipA-like protein
MQFWRGYTPNMSLLEALRSMRSKPSRRKACFELRYDPPDGEPVRVGRLEYDGQMWTFAYSDEYKRRADLRPIEGFDEVDKIYRSSVLFPFFAVRIPDVDRRDVRMRLAKDRVVDPEPADLLRIFGQRVVSSPAFELVPQGC